MSKREKSYANSPKNISGGKIMRNSNNRTNLSASANTSTNVKGGKEDMNDIREIIRNGIKNGEISPEEVRNIIDEQPEAKRAKVAKSKQLAPRTKAYSEANVRDIQRIINAGGTSMDIFNKYGISKTTIHRYLCMYHVYQGIAEKYWIKLLKNDKLSEASAECIETVDPAMEADTEPTEDVEAVESTAEADTEPAKEGVVDSENEECNPKYLIDSQLVQRHDGRCYWEPLVNELKSRNVTFAVHSKNRMRVLSEYYGYGAANLAKSIISDPTIDMLDTKLYLEPAAASIGACVITHTEQTAEACRNAGVNVMMVQDLLADSKNSGEECVHVLDPDDEEAAKWVKKLSLPISLNNNKRAIVALKDIAEYAEKHYGTKVSVKVADENKSERKTPTGVVRLKKGDFVIIKGENLNVILKISNETEKENCYEVYYSTAENTSAAKTA